MSVGETEPAGSVPVDGYGPGFFRISGQVHRGPTILNPEGVQPWGGLDDVAPLLALVNAVDVLFVGTGAEIARLPVALTARLEDAGLMVEALATPVAARSYNFTLSEGRRVACALIPV